MRVIPRRSWRYQLRLTRLGCIICEYVVMHTGPDLGVVPSRGG
jgi:hypothetical protein